ncbi:Complement C3 [Manis pentadactyla]|nr:Complement C3 [Manis pentadactyla]
MYSTVQMQYLHCSRMSHRVTSWPHDTLDCDFSAHLSPLLPLPFWVEVHWRSENLLRLRERQGHPTEEEKAHGRQSLLCLHREKAGRRAQARLFRRRFRRSLETEAHPIPATGQKPCCKGVCTETSPRMR